MFVVDLVMLCNSCQYQRENIACPGRKAGFGGRGHRRARCHHVVNQKNRTVDHVVAALRVGAYGAGDRFKSGFMPLSLKALGSDVPYEKIRATRVPGILGKFLCKQSRLIEPALDHPRPVKWYRRDNHLVMQDRSRRTRQP